MAKKSESKKKDARDETEDAASSLNRLDADGLQRAGGGGTTRIGVPLSRDESLAASGATKDEERLLTEAKEAEEQARERAQAAGENVQAASADAQKVIDHQNEQHVDQLAQKSALTQHPPQVPGVQPVVVSEGDVSQTTIDSRTTTVDPRQSTITNRRETSAEDRRLGEGLGTPAHIAPDIARPIHGTMPLKQAQGIEPRQHAPAVESAKQSVLHEGKSPRSGIVGSDAVKTVAPQKTTRNMSRPPTGALSKTRKK